MSNVYHSKISEPSSISSNMFVTGPIRISIMSPTLVRLEERGRYGFEDRSTFLVLNRQWPHVPVEIYDKNNAIYIKTSGYQVMVPQGAQGIKEVMVYDHECEKILWNGANGISQRSPLPHIGEDIYVLPDSPRIVPPPWGALPAPARAMDESHPLYNLSGWDQENDATDIYIFVYKGDMPLLRREFLKLTGPIPLPPLWAFGFWNSLYHPYTGAEAVDVIQRYRKEGIPLDVFVVDTDWRVGGSSGYDIEKKYFPDIGSFFKKAHENHVNVVMNDHPSSRGMKPIEPDMLRYRYDNLTQFLSMGLDTWWYDKNWYEFIQGPHDGIEREVWGQYLYHDIISHFCPGKRMFLLSMWSFHPASHRYPIWWTGDIHSSWDNLRDGIRDTLWFGEQCMPYVGQDLGGHIGNPDDELYVRFLQYGCLSPTARVHGSIKTRRYPWLYSKEAQEIVTEYIKLRYRLLPTIYSEARRAYEEGIPILRHPVIEWPQYCEADRYIEYMLGQDILVAPVYTQAGYHRLDSDFLRTATDKGEVRGVKAEYFPNPDLEGSPDLIRVEKEISIPRWAGEPMGYYRESFSVRWTGKILVPETGDYTFRTFSSDGVRLWIGDNLIIDNWTGHHEVYDTAKVKLEKGASVPIRLEFFNKHGFWIMRLDWKIPFKEPQELRHDMWIPPGEWQDLWTGKIWTGPQSASVESNLYKTPMFIRDGGIVILAPDMQYTGEKNWDPLTLDIFPSKKEEVTRTLYEDDGQTTAYQSTEFRKTNLIAYDDGNNITVTIEKPEGHFRGAQQGRSWILRLHLKQEERPETIFVDQQKLSASEYAVLYPQKISWPWMPFKGQGSNPPENSGPLIEVSLPCTDRPHKIQIVYNRR